LRSEVRLLRGDLLDTESLRAAVAGERPSEIYHLAAPSFIPASWQKPAEVLASVAGSAATILEATRALDDRTRVYVAASGAIFGEAGVSPQNEDTPCVPGTPYAVAKLAAHRLLGTMRDHFGLHASSGILFNHESERRPEQFVTRRITRGVAAIALGRETQLTLGALDAVRDWSFAGDVMYGAWLTLQQDEPGDYVLASGVGRTVAELARTAFACAGLDAEEHLRVEQSLVRAPERTPSVGDPARARELLGWRPTLDFEQLIRRMVAADIELLERSG
ncbi:MAG TPA: GDP-mannose 4,6-dehydratase, partial [Solirubrobacteraceae bacterium]|nr:GDP-mannose 4,6-dehydratase [Solirubrobacteraceae bacterium]